MAKLGARTDSKSVDSSDSKKLKPDPTDSTSATPSANANASATGNANIDTSSTTSASSENTNASASKIPLATIPPAAKPSKPKLSQDQEIAKWLTDILGDAFKVSLSPSNSLLYLDSISSDLNDANRQVNENDLESIFMEVLSEKGVPSPFKTSIDYLFGIYSKCIKLRSKLPKKEAYYEKKIQILSSIIDFCCNYGFICFQISDMFLNNDLETLVKTIVNNSNSMSGYLTDLTYKAIEQDGLLDLLNLMFPYISSQLYSVNLSNPVYNKYLLVFKTLIDIKSVAANFSKINGFYPPNAKDPLDFEHKTLLGGLLRLSPMIDQLVVNYFGNSFNEQNYSAVNSAYESITVEYKLIIDQLFDIVNKLIRGSPETRNALMKWLADLVNVSHLRTGSHADPTKLASDAIMFNITMILIKLSAPFLEYPTYSKLDKIDINYLINKHNLIDLKDESRINASIQESNEFLSEKEVSEPTNFISDCFYLTLTYLQYGIGGISVRYGRLRDQIKQLKERISTIEGNQVPPGSNPAMLQLLKNQLPKLNQQLVGLNGKKHMIKAIFEYRDLQLEIFDFIVGSTVFITKVIDPTHSHPKNKLKIPIYKIEKVSELDDQDLLKTKCPTPWRFFPEFFLEGIISYCKFTTNFRSCPLVRNYDKLLLFIEFSIILIRCPEVLGNPHMKSNIIEILFYGSMPMSDNSPGFLSEIFHSNDLVKQNILYSLLDLYVMIEKTGASSQFYDKFNSRYYISVVLEELWKSEIYRQQLTKYSTDNIAFFVRFIARMLNDTTYLLDETFNELNSIHKYQQEIKKRESGQPGNEEELGTTDEILKNLEASERHAKSYMGLCNKTMELFKLFTKEVPKGFMLPELVDRLAAMLDYNLEAMVGPKASNLKVSDPLKYDFSPKEMLQSLCQIYFYLSKESEFVKAVSRDGRSFNVNWFHKAEKILSSRTLTDPRIIRKLVEFGEEAEKQRLIDEDEELELGEIPDEYLDPLMFTLMEDPVILPSSRVSIDRSTIKAHLLSDSTDPFNRVPLKLEDVIPDEKLKQEIEDFKQQKRNERKDQMEID